MTDEITRAVQDRLRENGLTQGDLAQMIGKSPNTLSRTLNRHKDGGTVPTVWVVILEALDMELIAFPKKWDQL